MNEEKWLSFSGLLAYSNDKGLYVSDDISGIPILIVFTDGLPIIKFPDEDTLYLNVDDVIEWHLNESTYAADDDRTEDRLWYSVAATEFKRLKRDFETESPENVIPNRLFSDEYMRQAYAKAEREGNTKTVRNLKKARPDLFLQKDVVKPSAHKKGVKRKNRGARDVYFVQGVETKRIKIGVSSNVPNRVAQLVSSEPLELLGVIKGGGVKLEGKLHKKFAELRVHKEWFEPGQELVKYIENSTTQ